MMSDQVFIPSAMTRPAEAAVGLKPGVAVMANVARASAFARVVAIEGEGDERQITIKYEWGGSVSEEVLGADDLIVLTEALGFGQPVAIKEDDGWSVGVFVYADKASSWVLSRSKLVNVPAAKIKPLKVQKPFAKGAKVMAARFGTLKPGVVVNAIEGGVMYEVKFDDVDEGETVGLNAVTQPL